MIMTHELLGDYKSFIATIHKELDTLGIAREELAMMDHICYRVESVERYNELLQQFQGIAVLLGENEVSGRLIATFEFKDYLRADDWLVPYLELPAPKGGSPYAEGLEHVELVVVGSLSAFIQRHNNLSFTISDKLINPEAKLNDARVSVKFHEQPLGAVVRIENRLKEEMK
jgi:uncharacterized protein